MIEQLSMFCETESESMLSSERQMFRRALRKGSGFSGGKERIKQKAKELNKKNFAEFIRHEYGVGGFSFENGFVGSTTMGFSICKDNWKDRTVYSWTQVAAEILDMINTNSY